MTSLSVTAFTDTYFPSINGVTYTIKSWRDEWVSRGNCMEVVYPNQDEYNPASGEYPVSSAPFPFYNDFQLGLPLVPDSLEIPDIVHLHGPFTMGISGLRFSKSHDVPVIASYHTPISRYATYLSSNKYIEGVIKKTARKYEKNFYDRVDVVLTPSESTRLDFKQIHGTDTKIRTVTNGVDIDLFEETASAEFLSRNGINTSNPIIGYTGRHGYEKNLFEIVEAAKDLDITVIFGGDGPARQELERRSEKAGLDAHFLGFISREDLPAFYSSLDAFVFPGRNETQGLVALESFACGTPIVAVDAGALSTTVTHGKTGCHYQPGDIDGLRNSIRKATAETASFRQACLDQREEISIQTSVDQLTEVYEQVTS